MLCAVQCFTHSPPPPPIPATLQGHQGAVRCCVFSPNGKLLLTSSADATAILWDVATQRCLATYKRGDSG